MWGRDFEIPVGKSKSGNTIFDSNLMGVGGILEEALHYKEPPKEYFWKKKSTIPSVLNYSK